MTESGALETAPVEFEAPVEAAEGEAAPKRARTRRRVPATTVLFTDGTGATPEPAAVADEGGSDGDLEGDSDSDSDTGSVDGEGRPRRRRRRGGRGSRGSGNGGAEAGTEVSSSVEG